MAWVYLIGLAIVVWGACGGVIAIGRRLWSIDTTLRVHLIAAPTIAFPRCDGSPGGNCRFLAGDAQSVSDPYVLRDYGFSSSVLGRGVGSGGAAPSDLEVPNRLQKILWQGGMR